MGTKQFSNYSDLLTFTRASNGHALRPVSYGTELVTNGDYSNGTTGWTNDSSLTMDTFEVASGRLHIENTAGTTQAAYTDDNISLVAGKIYKFTAELEKVSGNDNWDIDIRVAALSTVRHTMTSTATTETLQVIFVATQTENTVIQITTRDTFEGYIDNVSVKEVFFDQTDGTLTLFEHPDNIPRVEWDADRNRLGLLVEEQRTNLVTYSEDQSQSNWTNLNGITKNVELTTAPDGTVSAGLIVPTTNNTYHSLRLSSFSVTSGQEYCFSVFVKSAGYSNFRLATSSQLSGILNTSVSSGEPVGNGWYRHTLVATAVTTSAFGAFDLLIKDSNDNTTFAGDGTSGIYVWGAQVEAGSFPTSYIKSNSGSTTTRSADVASIPVADFGFNASEGSVVCEVQHFTTENSSAHAAFAFDDGTSSNRMWYYQNKGQWIGSVSGTTTFSLGVIYPDENALTKVGVTYKKDDYVIYINGDNEGSDTSSNVPVVDTFYIGNTFDSTTRLNGHIKSIKYYPRRLSNAQLVELTS